MDSVPVDRHGIAHEFIIDGDIDGVPDCGPDAGTWDGVVDHNCILGSCQRHGAPSLRVVPGVVEVDNVLVNKPVV